MDMKSRLLALGMSVVLAGVTQQARLMAQQSLGDVARKESDRRATIAQPARVYTNADVPTLDTGRTEPSNAEAAQSVQPSGVTSSDAQPQEQKPTLAKPTTPLMLKVAEAMFGARLASLAKQIDKARTEADQ
jgi:hypothetical protein